MITDFDYLISHNSQDKRIKALSVTENNKTTTYGSYQDMYRERLKKTGVNNIQLQRLERLFNWGSIEDLEGNTPAEEIPEKDWTPNLRFLDYLRSHGKVKDFDGLAYWLNRLLPPKQKELGFSDTAYFLQNGFKLVPNFCEYEFGYKDVETGATVAFNIIPTKGLNLPNNLRLRLMYENPLLVWQCELEVMIILGGEYIRSIPPMRFLLLLHELNDSGFETKRIDPYADLQPEVGLFECARNAEKEDRYTILRSSESINSKKKGKRSGTVYFGSRTSDLCFRIYQTLAKHGYNAHRLEGEIKRKKAQLFTEMLLDIPLHSCDRKTGKKYRRDDEDILKDVQILIGNVLCGGFDLYDEKITKANGTIIDLVICEAWTKTKELLQATTPIRITIEPPVKTIMKTLGWIDRQIAKTLAKLYIGGIEKGVDFITATIEQALTRFDDKDWAELIAFDQYFHSGFA